MLAYDSHTSTDVANHIPDNTTPAYDARGRQMNFVESTAQRRERIQFLRQREWVRRVTEWVRETNAHNDSTISGLSSRSFVPFPNQDIAIGSQASAIPFPCVEEEEEEPYLIYSSSPNSSPSSLSEEVTPVLPLSSGPSLSLTVSGVPQPVQRRPSGHHRRCSSTSFRGHTRKQSLSSIFEVPEED